VLAIFVVEEKKRETHLAVWTERSGEGVAERLVADEEVVQLVIREHAFREVSDVENGGTSRADCRALKIATHENGIYLKRFGQTHRVHLGYQRDISLVREGEDLLGVRVDDCEDSGELFVYLKRYELSSWL
jgi:hypothetical protein